MRKSVIIAMMLVFVLSAAGLAQAASEAEKQAAIQSGLAWLAAQQQPDGHWNNSNGPDCWRGSTAAALLTLVEQKFKPGGWGSDNTIYDGHVKKAADYLLSQTRTMTFTPNWHNYTGFYGDNTGAYWASDNNTSNTRITYETGLVMPALTRYAQLIHGLNNPVTVPGFAGPITYKELLQRASDTFMWGQSAPGNVAYGGWRYFPGYNTSDNSTSQWPAIGMLYTENLAGTVVRPGTGSVEGTKDALKNWINYIQNPNGGSGYDNPTYIVNEAKTGGLLIEMVFAGGYGPPIVDGTPMARALDYLNANWKNTNSGYDGIFGQTYAMWSIYKGLESTIGLDDETTITNLNDNPGDVNNPNHGWNWWEDFCESLVNSQPASGAWSGYYHWDDILTTAWNINILNATQVPPPPVPIPGSLLLLGTGLLGIAALRRKFRN